MDIYLDPSQVECTACSADDPSNEARMNAKRAYFFQENGSVCQKSGCNSWVSGSAAKAMGGYCCPSEMISASLTPAAQESAHHAIPRPALSSDAPQSNRVPIPRLTEGAQGQEDTIRYLTWYEGEMRWLESFVEDLRLHHESG
jgi:hypothetical protein